MKPISLRPLEDDLRFFTVPLDGVNIRQSKADDKPTKLAGFRARWEESREMMQAWANRLDYVAPEALVDGGNGVASSNARCCRRNTSA
jgi:hypothetical protein